MAPKKQQFRFRIPWISGQSLSRPPKDRSKSGAQPDTNLPIQRPPFRPPGVAPAQSPSPTPASRQEKGKMAVPEPSKMETSSEAAKKMSTHPAGIIEDEGRSTPAKTKELELDGATGNSKAPSETQSKFHQYEPKDKGGKGSDTRTGLGQPIRRTKADKKQKEARETVERKMMFATSSQSGNDTKVVTSADPVIRDVSSISPEKPVPSNEEKASLQKGIKDGISEFVHELARVNPTQAQLMNDKEVSVVTLAGDNRGATMNVGTESAKKERSIHIHRAYRTKPEESNEVTTDEEDNSKKGSNNSMEKDEVGKTYVNSNIQSINNSLMLHGSITGRDPGVCVILPQQPTESIKPDDKRDSETRKGKAEVNVRRAERLTHHQPVVRRRCLRALFLEPSDSDPDKPRRHGCKFRCGETRKDMEIM